MIHEETTPQLQRGPHPTHTLSRLGTTAKFPREQAFLTTRLAA
jgi:hypothetical protein